MSRWELRYTGYDRSAEPLREALCTLGNGYMAVRGAAPEVDAGGAHYPGSYLAGLYNRLTTAVDGHEVENEDLVNAPNWISLKLRPEGEPWFAPDASTLLEYSSHSGSSQCRPS